jgi:hypothetical protein
MSRPPDYLELEDLEEASKVIYNLDKELQALRNELIKLIRRIDLLEKKLERYNAKTSR